MGVVGHFECSLSSQSFLSLAPGLTPAPHGACAFQLPASSWLLTTTPLLGCIWQLLFPSIHTSGNLSSADASLLMLLFVELFPKMES